MHRDRFHAAAYLVVLLLARHVEHRSRLGQRADPVLRKHGRAAQLHQEQRLADRALTTEHRHVANRDALVHQPSARRNRIERQIHIGQRLFIAIAEAVKHRTYFFWRERHRVASKCLRMAFRSWALCCASHRCSRGISPVRAEKFGRLQRRCRNAGRLADLRPGALERDVVGH